MNRDLLIADLKQAEGVRHVLYDDSTGQPIRQGSTVEGHPTIGVGRRCDVPWAEGVIDFLLEDSIKTTCLGLDQALPWWRTLADSQQRACVELAFTMGVEGLCGFSRMLIALQAGRSAGAACELLSSTWRRQVGEIRANRVARLLRT